MAAADDRGEVGERDELADLPLGLVEEARVRVEIGEVAPGDRVTVACKRRRERFERGAGEVAQDDAGTGRGEGARDGRADPSGRARHQHAAALEAGTERNVRHGFVSAAPTAPSPAKANSRAASIMCSRVSSAARSMSEAARARTISRCCASERCAASRSE